MSKPLWKRWYFWVGLVAVLAIIGALSQQGQDQAAPPPPPTQAAPATTSPAGPATKAPAQGCEEVPPAKVQDILGGSKNGTLTAVKASAFKSTDTGNYFIAIRIKHGAGEDTGVWQSSTLDNGPVGSVNAIAKTYTKWPDTKNAGSSGADRAERCAA